MKALVILYPGKTSVIDVKKNPKTGAISKYLMVELNQPDKSKDPLTIKLVGHSVFGVSGLGIIGMAYWPESWVDEWGMKEVKLFAKNRKLQQ